MNENERRILNELQKGLPLESRPFAAIAEKLDVTEDEVLNCLRSLKEKNFIRRFGGITNIAKLNVVSTLVAMKVPPEKLEFVAKMINEYAGVTHNYTRADEYNLWFTLMESSEERLGAVMEEIKTRTGIKDMLSLSGRKKYKTKVVFNF